MYSLTRTGVRVLTPTCTSVAVQWLGACSLPQGAPAHKVTSVPKPSRLRNEGCTWHLLGDLNQYTRASDNVYWSRLRAAALGLCVIISITSPWRGGCVGSISPLAVSLRSFWHITGVR